jgi:uncharacterized protein
MHALGYQGPMRTSQVDLLIVPDRANAGTDHWQSRWQRHFKTARRVEQDDWVTPRCDDWVARIVEAVEAATRPAILVAHGLGVVAVVHAAPHFRATRPAGAFLVAPPDLEASQSNGAALRGFAPVPMQPLPFASKLIGSSTDPGCTLERTQAMGAAWGSDVSIIAGAGHIDIASGHGAWPEGLLTFGVFLKRLG